MSPSASGPSPYTVFTCPASMLSMCCLMLSPVWYGMSAAVLPSTAVIRLPNAVRLSFVAPIAPATVVGSLALIGISSAALDTPLEIASATVGAPGSSLIGMSVASLASTASIAAFTVVLSVEDIAVCAAVTMIAPCASAPCPLTVTAFCSSDLSAFSASASPTAFASAASLLWVSVSSIGTVTTVASSTISSMISFRSSAMFIPPRECLQSSSCPGRPSEQCRPRSSAPRPAAHPRTYLPEACHPTRD